MITDRRCPVCGKPGVPERQAAPLVPLVLAWHCANPSCPYSGRSWPTECQGGAGDWHAAGDWVRCLCGCRSVVLG